MSNVPGSRAEKRDMDIWFHSDEGEPRFAVGTCARLNDGAGAVVYEAAADRADHDWTGLRVDDQGTEVWPTLVGAPGYWCWLLDLAVEAGFEW